MKPIFATLALLAACSAFSQTPTYTITYKTTGNWSETGFNSDGSTVSSSGIVNGPSCFVGAMNQSSHALSAVCQANMDVEIDVSTTAANPPDHVWLLVSSEGWSGQAPSGPGRSTVLVPGLSLNDGLKNTVISPTECYDSRPVYVPLTNGAGSVTISLSGQQTGPPQAYDEVSVELDCGAVIDPFGVFITTNPSPTYHAGQQDQSIPNLYDNSPDVLRADIGLTLEMIDGSDSYVLQGSCSEQASYFGNWNPALTISDSNGGISSAAPYTITTHGGEVGTRSLEDWHEAFKGDFGQTTPVTAIGSQNQPPLNAECDMLIHWHYPIEDLTKIALTQDTEWQEMDYISNPGTQPNPISFPDESADFSELNANINWTGIILDILTLDLTELPVTVSYVPDDPVYITVTANPGQTAYLIGLSTGNLVADNFYAYGPNGFQGYDAVPSEYYTAIDPHMDKFAISLSPETDLAEYLLDERGYEPYGYLIQNWAHFDD